MYDLKYIINHYHAMKPKTAHKQFIQGVSGGIVNILGDGSMTIPSK